MLKVLFSILLIPLILLVSGSLLAKETKKRSMELATKYQELPTIEQRIAISESEQHLKRKGNMNSLQTVPFLNKDRFQVDVGPAQFQLTIPFR